MAQQNDRICIIGMGFVGLSLAAALADAGKNILGVDVKPEIIEILNQKSCHFYEPQLQELIIKYGGKNLNFSLSIPDKSCNYYIFTVGTPLNRTTGTPDLSYLINAVSNTIPFIKKGDTIIVRSTVPVGTSRNIVAKMITSQTGFVVGEDIYFGFVPERIVEGKAIYELKHIPQIVGAINKKSEEKIITLLSYLTKKIITVPDMEHAEMCKLIDNTYRDVTFAYANQMAMVCERMGLDFNIVRMACNEDYERNRVPSASPGVGGICLTKDPYILLNLCSKLDIHGDLIYAARKVNEATVFYLAKKILFRLMALGRNIYTSKIFIMGFAFKGEPETSDIRFSTTIDLVNYLRPFCERLYGYDGIVSKNEIEQTGVQYCSIEDGFEDADVVIIMNTHKTHKGLDIPKLTRKSKNPVIFVDCWNLYNKKSLESYGNIMYSSIGIY